MKVGQQPGTREVFRAGKMREDVQGLCREKRENGEDLYTYQVEN